MIRQFNSTELAIFNDLGFTVVPEPSEYAIITAGALLLFGVLRRHKGARRVLNRNEPIMK